LIAHNAHVDAGVLRRHLGGWECPEVLDTLKITRRLLPGQVSYKLGALVTAFSLADGHSLACLFAADRCHHLETEIRKHTGACVDVMRGGAGSRLA
jgi:DNA polymerase III epsilon subunit-like protein